jgi:hypothetical protein
MSATFDLARDGELGMSDYDARIWRSLNAHWQQRDNSRGLPNWVGQALGRSSQFVGAAAVRGVDAVPAAIKQPIRDAGEAVASRVAEPTLRIALSLLELTNDWMLELNEAEAVEKYARKQGVEITGFAELRQQDLRVCDRLLTRNTLKWRTFGAVEGGAMGALAMVPVAGLPLSLTADVLVIQILSTAIAARIAYSYGFDAKDPDEQVFIQRLVRRSFMEQAAKAKPLRDAGRAAKVVRNRVNWSQKLRSDHRLLAAIERLLKDAKHVSHVPLKDVAKFVPVVGIFLGAGVNSAVLGNVAKDAQRYCQTRFLCEKYDLPLPAALAFAPTASTA